LAEEAEIDEGPSEEGPSLLPDSLTARASFTHGFPYYPYPNLPMTLQSVVNRCTNSVHIVAYACSRVNATELRFLHIFGCAGQDFRRPGPHDPDVGEADGAACTVTESMIAGSSGTPICGSFTGSLPMASTTSVPAITLPKMV